MAVLVGLGMGWYWLPVPSHDFPPLSVSPSHAASRAERLKPVHVAYPGSDRDSGLRTGQQIADRLRQWQADRSSLPSSSLSDGFSHLPPDRQIAIRRLLSELGPSAQLRMDRDSGTVRSLSGDLKRLVENSNQYRQSQARGDYGSMAVALADGLAPVLNLKDPRRELAVERVLHDEWGMIHVRLNQVLRGVPIWGAQIGVHFNADCEPVLVAGVYAPTPDIPEIMASITAEEALLPARRAIQVSPSTVADLVSPNVRPTIYWDLGREPVLCWNVELAPDWNQAWEIFVRQSDGSIVHRYDKMVTDAAEGLSGDMEGIPRSMPCWEKDGQYYAINTTLPFYNPTASSPPSVTKLRGAMYLLDFANQNPSGSYTLKDVTTNDANRWDPAAVSLMNNLMQTERYYRSVFSLNSLDNAGMNIWAALHWRWAQPGGGSHNNNACWNQTVRCMQFGDGDSVAAGRLPHALDITAHEYTHGVNSYAANLIYENQSGAIDEALSDFFACMVDRNDWWIGEDITAIGGKKAFRDLANPRNPDMAYSLPATMAEFKNTPVSDDHGGVHYNMSICARAGYLLAEEMNGGVSRGKAEQIFHRARMFYLTQRSQFSDFRRACETAARDLYGSAGLEVDAVQKAFDTVGVEESALVQISTPGTPTQGDEAILFLEADESAGWDEYHDGYFCRLFLRSNGSARPVTQRYVCNTLHGVSGDGKTILFIGQDNNLYSTDGFTEKRLSDSGRIRTIALSKDQRTIAYTTIPFEPYIHLIDTRTWAVRSVHLSVPLKDANPQPLQYADVLSFNFRGDYLFFDAVSEMKLATGESILTWGIFGMRLADGLLFMVVAQSSDEQIGNPVMANTIDHVMLADRVVFDDHVRYHLETVSIDFNKSQINTLLSGLTRFSQSSFKGDDREIVYRDYDKMQLQYALYQAPLVADRSALSEAPTIILTSISAIAHPYGFRIGQFTAREGKLQVPANVVFGLVQENQILKRPVTITNSGNADIQILGLTFEGSHPDWFLHNAGNQILAPNQSASFQVVCQAKGGGELGTRLVIFSTDPNQPQIAIPLNGEVRGSTNPTPDSTPSPTPTPTATPTPTVDPASSDFSPSILYEFDRASLEENGWSSIPGGFEGAAAGTAELGTFPENRFVSSQDGRGLTLHTDPGQVAFLYASQPIHTGGYPALLRLTLRADASDAAITLAALKGGIWQADGSIAFQPNYSTRPFAERETALTLLYQPDSFLPITPVVQLAGGTSGGTVWIDRLEILIVNPRRKYPGFWFDSELHPQAAALFSSPYEFDQPTLEQNGWLSIPGGFNSAPEGKISLTALEDTLFPSSQDQRGLRFEVAPGEVAFIYASQPISTARIPVLLRLTLRSDSPNATIALGALKGPIQQADGSLTAIMPQTSAFCSGEPYRLIALYQPLDMMAITPFIQVANTGANGAAVVWVDCLEWIGVHGGQMFEGTEFSARPLDSGLPESITIPMPNMDIAAKPLQMIYLSAGTFTMGSPAEEPGRSLTDEALRRVTLTNPLYIGRFEITQAHWVTVMGRDDPPIELDLVNKKNNPILNVAWFDAIRFCNRLSVLQGLVPAYDESTGTLDFQAGGFRLPTEAEWEYACRAGSSTRFFWGEDRDESQWVSYARCDAPAELGVGFPRLQNAWGLWDMSGNAVEWCQNWFSLPGESSGMDTLFNPLGPVSGMERTVRGGSYLEPVSQCRSASRLGYPPAERRPFFGFRIVKPLQ